MAARHREWDPGERADVRLEKMAVLVHDYEIVGGVRGVDDDGVGAAVVPRRRQAGGLDGRLWNGVRLARVPPRVRIVEGLAHGFGDVVMLEGEAVSEVEREIHRGASRRHRAIDH